MKRLGFITRIALLISAFAVVVFSAHNLPAGLYVESSDTTVEIDGVNFGSFDKIKGLDFNAINAGAQSSAMQISLGRDFVTDPSLYQWAQKVSRQRLGQKDIHLVKRNDEGKVVTRYVLKLSQPISWTVEAANPALGGFHETVDIAVQGIEVH